MVSCPECSRRALCPSVPSRRGPAAGSVWRPVRNFRTPPPRYHRDKRPVAWVAWRLVRDFRGPRPARASRRGAARRRPAGPPAPPRPAAPSHHRNGCPTGSSARWQALVSAGSVWGPVRILHFGPPEPGAWSAAWLSAPGRSPASTGRAPPPRRRPTSARPGRSRGFRGGVDANRRAHPVAAPRCGRAAGSPRQAPRMTRADRRRRRRQPGNMAERRLGQPRAPRRDASVPDRRPQARLTPRLGMHPVRGVCPRRPGEALRRARPGATPGSPHRRAQRQAMQWIFFPIAIPASGGANRAEAVIWFICGPVR